MLNAGLKRAREPLSPSLQSLGALFCWIVRQNPLGCLGLCLAPMAVLLETNLIPYGMKVLVEGLSGEDTVAIHGVSKGLGIIGGAWVAMVGSFRFYGWIQARLLPELEAEVRMRLTHHVLGHSYAYFLKGLSGNLSNKIMDLVKALEAIREVGIWGVGVSGLVLGVTFWMMWGIHPFFVGVFGLWCCLHVGFSLWSAKHMNRSSRASAEAKSQLTGRLVDTLSNMLTVKLFTQQKAEFEYLQQEQQQEKECNEHMMRTMNYIQTWMDVSVTLMVGMVLCGLIYLLNRRSLQAGDVVLLLGMVFGVVHQLWSLGHALSKLFRDMGTARQALDHLMASQEMVDREGALPLHIPQGGIEFNKVTFGYGADKLFQGFELTIQPGEKVGLVGFSGSGKTTLMNLLLRLFEVQEGAILVDGEDIRGVQQASLRQQIGIIPQEPPLFHRGLLENIRYGRPTATEEEVITAARQARCHEFIMALPEGYATEVGERGVKLSGGQRQRIAIARVLLKDPKILILDEATSALDSMTEEAIYSVLLKKMNGRTTMVIAHRLSTLLEMDRLVVLDQGKIVEVGTHSELLHRKGYYARMWERQAGGFLPDRRSDG